MNEKQRFLMLIGIAGSGKSTVAEELIDGREDIVYLSSDELRVELLGNVDDQSKQADVFGEMEKRTKQALKDGKHVVYDATNISRKKRTHLLNQLPRDVKKVACYISTPYDIVIEQNDSRERVVPHGVINRMYKTLNIPIYSEGWDKIVFHHHDSTVNSQYPKQFTDAIRAEVLLNREGYGVMMFLASYFEEFYGVYELAQDSKHHSLSASRHIYYVYKHILDNYVATDDEDREVMLWAGLLHDVGKAFCKSFENRKREITRHANFIGHDFVGSQMAVHFLHRMNFDDKFIYKVSTLIQFHMYLLDRNANEDKLRRYVGDGMFEKLKFLRDADTLAH
jgi:predicted kinase